MILNFRSKALKQAFTGDVRKLMPQIANRVVGILAVLNSSESLKDIEPLTGFHALTGDKQGTYAVSVTRNWRITFVPVLPNENESEFEATIEINGFNVRDVDYEDYH